MCWKQQFPYYRYTSISIRIEGKKHISTVVNIFECLCLCSYTNFLRRINYILYIFVIINQRKKYNTHYSEFSFYLIDIYLTVSNNKYCERSVNVLLIGANIFPTLFIYYQKQYEWIQYFIQDTYEVRKTKIDILSSATLLHHIMWLI